jgi:hypothetical protein
VVVSASGTHVVEVRTAGSGALLRSATFKIDSTLPDVVVISPDPDLVVDLDGGTPVVVDYACSDPMAGPAAPSGIASCRAYLDDLGDEDAFVADGADIAGLLSQGDHTLYVVGIDAAGNQRTAAQPFKKAGVVFTITGDLQSGWYRSNVTVEAEAVPSDQTVQTRVLGPGLPANPPYTGTATVTVPLEGTGFVVQAKLAGASKVFSTAPFKIDKTAPNVTIGSPADGSTHVLGANVPLSFTCSDAISGLATGGCSAKVDGVTVAAGANLGLQPGSHVLVVTGRDQAGNERIVQRTYTISQAPAPWVGALTFTGLRSLPFVTTNVSAPFFSSPHNGPHTLLVDWGDGTTSTCQAATSTSTCQVVDPSGASDQGSVWASHRYPLQIVIGRTITVTVIDQFGRPYSRSSWRLL